METTTQDVLWFADKTLSIFMKDEDEYTLQCEFDDVTMTKDEWISLAKFIIEEMK